MSKINYAWLLGIVLVFSTACSAKEDSILLQEIKQIEITEQEFAEHKESVELVHEYNQLEFDLTDEELLDRMLKSKLLQQMANEQNMPVREDEVMDYALQTKMGFQQTDSPQMQEIIEILSIKYNVSTDDYFTHPDVLAQYENTLKVEKLINQMALEGNITDNYTVDRLAEDLLKQYKDSMNSH
ncbi:hypothetical protein [Metasolibacillus meyeri]|uniref:hypothetical protein n=1 Tax=Metasolibacillus meyeri TaxID=1071052 RepID=UPI000D2F4A8E|nr:hypothetical protein [Metasolibacillus meyeri]